MKCKLLSTYKRESCRQPRSESKVTPSSSFLLEKLQVTVYNLLIMTNNSKVSIALICVIGISLASISPPSQEIRTSPVNGQNFLYIGNAEGKIYLKAVPSPQEEYGVTWQRALEICADAGYRMAGITSKAQNDVVRAFVTGTCPDSKNWLWIDGSNFANSNFTWFSLHTGKNLEFFDWVPQRPVNPPSTSRRCIRWSSNSFEAGWWDMECDDTHNVLCQDSV